MSVDDFERFQRKLRGTEMGETEDLINLTDTQDQSINSESTAQDMTKIIEMMIQENRRRDDLFERMLTRFAVPQRTPTSPPISTNNVIHVIPDLTRNIKSFDGEKGGTRAHEWITDLENMQQLHNWSDSFTLETARSHLIGGAKHWYNNRIREIESWQKFQAAFKKTFVGLESLPVKWKRMTERFQKRGESVQTYFHEKLKLCTDVGCNFKEAKEQILVGLFSDKLQCQQYHTQMQTSCYTT